MDAQRWRFLRHASIQNKMLGIILPLIVMPMPHPGDRWVRHLEPRGGQDAHRRGKNAAQATRPHGDPEARAGPRQAPPGTAGPFTGLP
jgi:hypothetical protein